MANFDLIIIGGGAGAFAAAIRANELKAKTALVNTGLPLGGTCVNVGCVPSKTLLWAGEIMHVAKHHGTPGIELELKHFDFQQVMQDELALVAQLRQEKYAKVLQHLQHVTLIEGRATFVSAHAVQVNGKRLSAEKFLIAAGSTATVPPITGIQEVGYITHIEALQLTTQPRTLIVVGAGPLGLEFAQMYARFGTQVTILQRNPSVFPRGEGELTARLAQVLTQEGITIKTKVALQAVRKARGKKVVSYSMNGKQEEVSGDEILLAAGKTPNTQGLGLETADVNVDSQQAIIVNPFFQTSAPHMYAVGDVTNLPLRLETTAGHEGTLAAENALTGSHHQIDYQTVPYTIFTDPQLSRF